LLVPAPVGMARQLPLSGGGGWVWGRGLSPLVDSAGRRATVDSVGLFSAYFRGFVNFSLEK